MLNLKLRLDIVFCTHAGYKNYYIIRYNMRAAAILGHEPAIDPATHLGGKADKVRWIAQGPTYHNHLVCLKSSCA